MIEADMSHPPGIVTEDELVSGLQVESSEYMLQRRTSFISFDVFREEYWAHFPQSLTKGLGSFHLPALFIAVTPISSCRRLACF
jgi:hypothetical protein